jgi:hypothetical protein
MAFRFDATQKELVRLTAGDYAASFRLGPAGSAHLLDVDLSTLSAATDAALGFGDPLDAIADLNFQASADAFLPERGLLYNAALRFRFHFPVRSLFILLRPDADHRSLSGSLSYGEPPHRLEFQYEVIRVWQRPAEQYLNGSLGLLPLAVLGELPASVAPETALHDIAERVAARLRAEAPHERAVRMMEAAFILTGLRVRRPRLRHIFRGVDLMSETTAFEAMVEEGEIRQSRKILLRQGRQRFGPYDPETESAIKAIEDLELLERMVDAVLTANSWQELLATP